MQWRFCLVSHIDALLHVSHSITNSQESHDVLSSVTSMLKSYPFDFRGAKILSGEDEGVFGWVTANYLLENFIKVRAAGLASEGSPCP